MAAAFALVARSKVETMEPILLASATESRTYIDYKFMEHLMFYYNNSQ